jgi:NAD(P)H-hydrate epimerase
VQTTVPQAITGAWSGPVTKSTSPLDSRALGAVRADALVIGPGLGRGDRSRAILRAALDAHPDAPVVLDADALNLIAHQTPHAAHRIREWCGPTRPVVCTPHPQEFARLIGRDAPADWRARDDALREFAARADATVLLKGAPTLIASPRGPVGDASASGSVVVVAPYGSAVLATGGSGDMLAGIIGTLLAQGVKASDAALLGARAHGSAAEIVSTCQPRGHTLDHVMRAMPEAWARLSAPVVLPPGVLAEWPALT